MATYHYQYSYVYFKYYYDYYDFYYYYDYYYYCYQLFLSIIAVIIILSSKVHRFRHLMQDDVEVFDAELSGLDSGNRTGPPTGLGDAMEIYG